MRTAESLVHTSPSARARFIVLPCSFIATNLARCESYGAGGRRVAGTPARLPCGVAERYSTAEEFMALFMASVFFSAFLCVTEPATSSLPMDSAGVQKLPMLACSGWTMEA